MNSKNKSVGLGVIDIVQIVFIILKLCKLINWSWWIVLIPFWITLIMIIGILIYAVCN